jgi:hypothetical protein
MGKKKGVLKSEKKLGDLTLAEKKEYGEALLKIISEKLLNSKSPDDLLSFILSFIKDIQKKRASLTDGRGYLNEATLKAFLIALSEYHGWQIDDLKEADKAVGYILELLSYMPKWTTTLQNVLEIKDHQWLEFANVARDADYAKLFKDSCKKDRFDAFNQEIIKTHDFLKKRYKDRKLTARDIWNALPEISDVIEEKNSTTIYWINKQGKPKSSDFGAFQNRLTRLKRKNLLI